jgi:hypothetical protein
MEFTHTETTVIRETAVQAVESQAHELDALQLALVGGGNVIILFN